jgi:hypothetical protein
LRPGGGCPLGNWWFSALIALLLVSAKIVSIDLDNAKQRITSRPRRREIKVKAKLAGSAALETFWRQV